MAALIKERRPLAHMRHIADALAAKLAGVCTRVEVAGSIRRDKPMIGDIELCVIPPMQGDLFGVESPDLDALTRHMDAWPIAYNKQGDRYRQFTFDMPGAAPITVDLFLANPDNYGYILMLRTGSWEFSKRMVSPREWGGMKPEHIRVADGVVYEYGAAVAVPDEERLFALWGMDYIEPKERT